MIRRNYITVDLGAVRENYRLMRGAAGCPVMAVVKADAYGHGAAQVALALQQEGAAHFAVAIPEEGVALREAGVTGEILVLGATMPDAVETGILYGLSMTVFRPEEVYALDAAAEALGRAALVHIKLDTGMGRIGIRTEEEAMRMAGALKRAEYVQARGVYTHFSTADEPEDGHPDSFAMEQLERFRRLRAFFPAEIPAHAANSAMSLLTREADFSMIRQGISLYGYPPVKTELPFRPALRWRTEVTGVKTVPAGTPIGYGRSFITKRETVVATAAVGYGDGYHRAASNRGAMLVGGRRAPILGRVCMDQTMLDITDIPGVWEGDEVVLIGRQGDEEITAEELAGAAGTICYEVLLAPTARVPRVWQDS